ncbi:MAG: hypothetical protein ABI947_21815 [Chloroflexota bacterium]
MAGCGQIVTTTATRTPTLLSLAHPTITPTAMLRLIRTPTLYSTYSTALALAPTVLPLPLLPPKCYETPVGSLWCFGLIRNTQDKPIGQIMVRVYLVSSDGSALVEKQVASARASLAPGEFTPYGVLFDSQPAGSVGPVVMLISAVNLEASALSTSVKVNEFYSETRDGAYHITGTLINSDSKSLRTLSLVVTLLDGEDHVTGFRQVRWDDAQVLMPTATLPFTVDVIPFGQGPMRVEISAEGHPVG